MKKKDKSLLNRRSGLNIQPRHTFIVLAVICILLIVATSFSSSANNNLRMGVNTALMPVQKGFNYLGRVIFDGGANVIHLAKVEAENEKLKEQVDTLTEQNTRYQLQLTELEECRRLLNLKEQYPKYDMIGANVIGKNSDNWYKTIQVDRGSFDGIEVNMNVIADGGLVGIVTAVTPTTSTISTIINDNRNVGAMGLRSKDSCIVSGDLTLYHDGLLGLSKIAKEDDIESGDKIVTSNTSDLYVPGLLIGYADSLKVDANNLTKSGYLIPVVDFSHLESVLIITTLKDSGAKN